MNDKLVGIVFTTKDPCALPVPGIPFVNPIIVNASPGSKPCGPTVLTVTNEEPIPFVPAEASVVTESTSISVPGIS